MEFEVNKYIKLKLVKGKTLIYIDGKRFIQCIRLFIQIPVDKIEKYDQINSIDEAAEIYKKTLMDGTIYEGVHGLTPDKLIPQINPEEEFWAHCSNIQVWCENDYDTRILHSNIAFPLLKKLDEIGDLKAHEIIKEEIALRLENGTPNVFIFLFQEGLLDVLDYNEFNIVMDNFSSKNDILNLDLISELTSLWFKNNQKRSILFMLNYMHKREININIERFYLQLRKDQRSLLRNLLNKILKRQDAFRDEVNLLIQDTHILLNYLNKL